ncbi:MAG TPA: class I SAM-dependent methyltransferase, partial [Chitinophagaceae bacterium]|nr:class I SAM-dependent methyltransferase [Chitinophagaceae bacterium]
MSEIKTSIFESEAQDYDAWFDRHAELFQSECLALQKLVPGEGIGVEIGVGTGRFAGQLNISVGVEPAHSMAQMALARGITVIKASAEDLPFHDQTFDFALMVTTVCFLNDIPKAFNEAHRVLKKNGVFIIGMIDKESERGKGYEAQKTTNPWYRDAHFHSVKEITDLLERAGFT